MPAREAAIQARLDKINHGWRERTKYNTHLNCRQCNALIKHSGVSCKDLASRLAMSARNDYDPSNPWAWPPKELYEP